MREQTIQISALEVELEKFREDQRMGRKVLQGQREAWLAKHDALFNRSDLIDREEERLLDLHERFLRHFMEKPNMQPGPSPTTK